MGNACAQIIAFCAILFNIEVLIWIYLVFVHENIKYLHGIFNF